jgi:hypothetical protein
MPKGRNGEHLGSAGGTAPGAGRGNNHGWRGGAIARLLAAALLATGLAAGVLAPPRQAAAQEENPLVQRGIPAEATAENAVVARDRALAAGQRIAYERMATALGLPRNLPDQQIEAMVASLVIESERITPRGYTARITVNFKPPGSGMAVAPSPSSGSQGSGPTVATLEAVAQYRSLPEYVEITRRLGASPAVARYEVVTVSGEAARLRLALRSQPQVAAAELGRGGLSLAREQDPRLAGEGWRLGLAGGR